MSDRAHQTKERRGRGCLLWLGGAIVLVAVLVLVGAVYESVTEASDVRSYPPPGQMVDVGGYRLHINCTGAGSPVVVIDAGWGDWSLGWSWVQPGVAKTTRVCTYDRAGMGYSEAGPLPRDAEQFARELNTLLDRAGIPGPIVLVGHSLGGLPVRVFAHEYPAKVAGVVLIESMSPEQAKGPPAGAKPGTPSRSSVPSIPSLLARIGLVRLLSGPALDLPPEAKQACVVVLGTPRSVQAWTDEGTGLPASLAEAGAVQSFGNLPLIVMSAALNQQPPGWPRMQANLLQLSSNSQAMIADKSDHNVQVDQPEAAVDAIVKMVEQLRQSARTGT